MRLTFSVLLHYPRFLSNLYGYLIPLWRKCLIHSVDQTFAMPLPSYTLCQRLCPYWPRNLLQNPHNHFIWPSSNRFPLYSAGGWASYFHVSVTNLLVGCSGEFRRTCPSICCSRPVCSVWHQLSSPWSGHGQRHINLRQAFQSARVR